MTSYHQAEMSAPVRSAVLPLALVGSLVAVVVPLLVSNNAAQLPWLFPGLSLIVGIILYVKYPVYHLSFIWWLWFLTPEVRRIVDYSIGWNPIDTTVLAPYLACLPMVGTVIRAAPILRSNATLPFAMVFGGISYAYLIGIQRASVASATYAALNWTMPVVLGLYLLIRRKHAPAFRDALTRTFVLGGLVTGIYGLVQFFYLPDWDAYWMENAGMNSEGAPFPQLLRVFGTMNSSGPFAVALMASLIVMLTLSHPLRWWAVAPTFASILLSLVRASWFGFGVAMIYLFFQARSDLKVRRIAAMAVLVAISLPVLTIGPIADTIDRRFATLADISEDQSYQARVSFYSNFLDAAFTNVIGEGFGATGTPTKMDNEGDLAADLGTFDSGVMEVPFLFGWPGSALYLGGLAWIVVLGFRSEVGRRQAWTLACRAIVVGILAQMIFADMLNGVTGMIVWCFLGMMLADRANARESMQFVPIFPVR